MALRIERNPKPEVVSTLLETAGATQCLVRLQGERSSSWLIENSLLVTTAIDDNIKESVGLLALSHAPPQPSTRDWCAAQKATSQGQPYTKAWVTTLVTARLYEATAVRDLLQHAFSSLPHLQTILLCQSADIGLGTPGLASTFAPCAADAAQSLYLFECRKATLMPSVRVRPARVTDHDDLLPIVQRSEARYPALAQLPETAPGSNDYALASLISSQDAQNMVLVAERDGKLAGLMSVTADVDISVLQQSMDLHAYDLLIPPHVYDVKLRAARARLDAAREAESSAGAAPHVSTDGGPGSQASASSPSSSKAGSKAGSVQSTPRGMPGLALTPRSRMAPIATGDTPRATATPPISHQGSLTATAAAANVAAVPGIPNHTSIAELAPAGSGDHASALAAQDGELPATALSLDDDPSTQQAVAEQLAEFVPTEEDVTAVLQDLANGGEGVPANAFAITMLCLEDGCEHQTRQLLQAAFDAFPDKEYCLVTLPPESAEPPLLQQFARLHAPPQAGFPDVLFLFHRHGMLEDFQVRRARAEDVTGVVMLVEGMPSRRQVFTSFLDAVDAGAALVATCQDQIVGLATLRLSADLALLQANFRLTSLLDLAQHSAAGHAEVDVFCLNPIFNHRAAVFLSEIMRQLEKTCLHYALLPHQPAPDVLKVFRQVPARHLCQPQPDSEAVFALFTFSPKWAHNQRPTINSHIIVVGASECGLAVLEQLLTSERLAFSALTLLAPGGVMPGGVGSTFTESLLSQLGLEASVTVLDTEMVALDRQHRMIQLSIGQQLQYGMLVLTSGISHQPLLWLAPEPGAAVLDPRDVSPQAMAEGAEGTVPHRAIVYGATLEAFTAGTDLRSVAGDPDAVLHVAPLAGAEQGWIPLLMEAARLAGITIPSISSLEIESVHQGPEASLDVTFRAANGVKHLRDTDALVLADTPDVDPAVFTCANSTSLVYDGRLVVDGAFRTADPCIWAGGTLTKFSRRYGRDVLLQHYNSRQVGARLADALISVLAAPEAPVPETPPLPHLGAARVVGSRLPGGNIFAFSGMPLAVAAPSMEAPQGGKKLSTAANGSYMHLMLDSRSCVESVLYCGPAKAFPPAKLACLVGLHVSYLNDIENRYNSGRITHLAEFLSEAWADLLYHDEFPTLRAALQEITLTAVQLSSNTADSQGLLHDAKTNGDNQTAAHRQAAVLSQAQDAVLSFVRGQGPAQLPVYTLPVPA